MKIIDISRNISKDMPVWPGDPNVSVRLISQISEQGCNVSELCAGLHTGTHIDAPWHYVTEGKKVHELDLSRFYGSCKVFEIHTYDHVKQSDIDMLDVNENDIVLFKTRNSLEEQSCEFDRNYCALSLSASEWLVNKKIKTVGVDYLSVEPYGGNGDVHRTLLENNIGVIEGLDLTGVKPGNYMLSALPLKLISAEGSPVRAVLIEV
ncbi:MAG TPA: polyketide cyclase [Clostridiales bacterium]|nr:polyketide cyclase [Clostridiales bacterium]